MIFDSISLPVKLPFYSSLIQAGFPSPADDHVEGSIDLQSFLVPHPASTFMMRAANNEMSKAGVLAGDVLVVDRSLNPKNQDLVITYINGSFLVRRFVIFTDFTSGVRRKFLISERDSKKRIAVKNETQIWGVVSGVVRALRK